LPSQIKLQSADIGFFIWNIIMHPLILLPAATFIILIGYLTWNWYSTKRNLETGGKTKGLGGENDPMV